MDLDAAAAAFREFAAVIRSLRTPITGCPWDLEQDHRSLRPYLVEETHEVLEAIDRADDAALREELGDLLLQVVLHAQLADDRGAFSITEVVREITAKMVRRHPHVFGGARADDAAEVLRHWERIKAAEKPGQAADDAFDRIPRGLPALLRAQRLGAKAGLPSVAADFDEIRRALATLEAASPAQRAEQEQALGDVLFGLCQAARRLGLGAEDCLRESNQRFVERVRQARDVPSDATDPAANEPRA